MDIMFVARLLSGFIVLILLATSYMYVEKLERIGCACSDHPYRNFIKGYTAVAFVFILAMMFLPQEMILRSTNGVYAMFYTIFAIAFLVSLVLFFVLSIQYVRYLVTEKCKCSDDIRREVLYYWSIAHLIYLGIVVLIPIFLAIIGGFLALTMNTVQDVKSKHGATYEAMTNPFKGMKDVPKKLKDELKSLKALSKVATGRK